MFLFLRLSLIKFVLQQKVKYSNVIFLEQKKSQFSEKLNETDRITYTTYTIKSINSSL
jgi:hypothetical protein